MESIDIRMFKNTKRISFYRKLSSADIRIAYKMILKIKELLERKSKNRLNSTVILIHNDGKDIFLKRNTLQEHNILTINELFEYMELTIGKYLLVDGKRTDDTNLLLTDIVSIELYSTDENYIKTLYKR